MDVGSRLRACERRWGLQAGGRLGGGFRSDVFDCTTSTGSEVVVKLSATSEEARAEAAALTAWMPTRAAAQLIDVDGDLDALLLERVRPGTALSGGDGLAAVAVAADLLMRLHGAEPGGFCFPTLAESYPRLEDQARDDAAYERRTRGDPARGAAGLDRLGAAATTARELCASIERTVLLHGDFLRKNVLLRGTGYAAIDPMPRVGDPCADVGFFAADQPPATILDRAVLIAERMGVDQHRARRWAAVWTVLQAAQAWREDQRDLEGALTGQEFDDLLTAPT